MIAFLIKKKTVFFWKTVLIFSEFINKIVHGYLQFLPDL